MLDIIAKEIASMQKYRVENIYISFWTLESLLQNTAKKVAIDIKADHATRVGKKNVAYNKLLCYRATMIEYMQFPQNVLVYMKTCCKPFWYGIYILRQGLVM